MYLNLIQVAESLGVSENTIEGWVRDQGLPHMVDRGRFLFDRAQVAQWAAERGLGAQAGFLAPEAQAGAPCRVEPLLRVGKIWHEIDPGKVPEIFDAVVAGLPGATGPVRQLLGQRLRAPGGITWAPVGGGFALPHPSTRITLGRNSGAIALLLLKEKLQIPGNGTDGVPISCLLFFIAPSPRAHLDLLGRLSRLLRIPAIRGLLLGNPRDEEVFTAIHQAEAPAGEPR